LYIAVGVVTSVAVVIAMAFSLLVLVPALSQLTAGIDHSLDTRVLGAISFSKYDANDTYVYVLHDVHTTCVYVLRTAAVISGPIDWLVASLYLRDTPLTTVETAIS